mmetsp:Transcript_29887/g.85610  ORF Transcript_29887/g.85610 Transcript_29887/m.85610 type:complete len:255 (+) Transcript_29887:178-942(+)
MIEEYGPRDLHRRRHLLHGGCCEVGGLDTRPLLGHLEKLGVRLPNCHFAGGEARGGPGADVLHRDLNALIGLADAIRVVQVDPGLTGDAGNQRRGAKDPLPEVAVHAGGLSVLHLTLEQALHNLHWWHHVRHLVDAGGDRQRPMCVHAESGPLLASVQDDRERLGLGDVGHLEFTVNPDIQHVGVKIEGDLCGEIIGHYAAIPTPTPNTNNGLTGQLRGRVIDLLLVSAPTARKRQSQACKHNPHLPLRHVRWF